MNSAQILSKYGQSLWLDYSSVNPHSDQILAWLEDGLVSGMTTSSAWVQGTHGQTVSEKAALRLLAHAGLSSEEILFDFIVEESRRIADELLPIYEQSNGEGGFLTIGIDPRSYPDHEEMLNRVIDLWQQVNRPNLLIGIPTSPETLPVIEAALMRGINISASMICSLEQYLSVVETYLNSLETRLERGDSLDHILSTAEFFVGDIDNYVNHRLEQFQGEGMEAQRAGALVNQTALAIAKLAYAQFNVFRDGARFRNLAEHGARMLRIVWGRLDQNSNQAPLDYLSGLLGAHTVIAASPGTIEGLDLELTQMPTLEEGLSEARGKLQALDAIGVSMHQVAGQIRDELIEQQNAGYLAALRTIESVSIPFKAELGPAAAHYPEVLQNLSEQDVVRRLWKADGSLWAGDRRAAKQVEAKLGWLDLPLHFQSVVDEVEHFSHDLKAGGTQELVMVTSGSAGALLRALIQDLGGSPLTLALIDLSEKDQGPDQKVTFDPDHTHFVFVVDQTETDLVMEYIESIGTKVIGIDDSEIAERATIITHADTVDRLKKRGYEFGNTFCIPESIPYHYSVIGYPLMLAFGWLDQDLQALQAGFSQMVDGCLPSVPIERNPGAGLAGSVAAALQSGRDRIVLSGDPSWTPYCEWVVQFWERAGLRPALGADLVRLDVLAGMDAEVGNCALIYLSEGVQPAQRFEHLIDAGVPVKIVVMEKVPGSASQLVALVEFATAVLGHVFEFNPFG